MTDVHTERRAALIALALAAPLGLLIVLVTWEWGPLMTLDTDVVTSWYGAVEGSRWEPFFDAVATVFASWHVTAFLGVVALVFAFGRDLRSAAWVAVGAALSYLSWVGLKHAIGRERPDVPDQIGGYAFPSGHATSIAAAAAILVVLTYQRVRRPRLRWALITLWIGIGVLVGADRVAVGAHYPSDVLAGWLLGVLIVFLTSALLGIVSTDPEPPAERPLSTLPDTRTTLAVILNPIKVDDIDGFRARINAAARASGWDEPLWFETTVDDAGASMARAALAAGADILVAAGGDGTVRVVCAEMAGRGIPVGIIPVGTGNLLARNLGIPLGRDQALEVVLNGQDRAVDTVRIDGDGIPETRFMVMAGLGLDAAIMDAAPDELKARIGWTAYVVAGAKHLRYPAVRVDISVDGGEPIRRRARTVVIGNVGSLQAGIPLLPDAEIDDGKLDVVVVAPRKFFGWVPVAARVVTRRRRTDEKLDRYTGRSVVVTTPHPTPRQLDGDTVGPGTELRAEIEPGVLLVRVPR